MILGGLVTSTLLNLFIVPSLYLRYGRSAVLDQGRGLAPLRGRYDDDHVWQRPRCAFSSRSHDPLMRRTSVKSTRIAQIVARHRGDRRHIHVGAGAPTRDGSAACSGRRTSGRPRSCIAPPAPRATARTARDRRVGGRLRRAAARLQRLRVCRGEPDPDWQAVVHEGGPIRGLDRHMPAFGDALSSDEIRLVIGHLRTFCTEPAWPRGDLNLPRALLHREGVSRERSGLGHDLHRPAADAPSSNELIYERRLGARNQIEVSRADQLPAGRRGEWSRGLGDVALAFKRTLYASMRHGRHRGGRNGGHPADRQGAARARERLHRLRAVRDVGADPAAQRVPADARRRRAADRLRARPREATCAPRSAPPSRRTADSAARGRRRSRCCGRGRRAARRSGTSCRSCR